jgi:DNA-directed RNA polymerase subunit omega
MIELLKDDKVIEKVGGRFKLTALIQRRWVELMQGERPMVDPAGKNELEVIVQEILEGKIAPQLGAAEPEEEETEADAGI